MTTLTFEQLPALIGQLYAKIENIESMLAGQSAQVTPLPKYVDINGASQITSKSPNALRVQVSLGNLIAIKKGSRNYFDREYLEEWLSGDLKVKGASARG